MPYIFRRDGAEEGTYEFLKWLPDPDTGGDMYFWCDKTDPDSGELVAANISEVTYEKTPKRLILAQFSTDADFPLEPNEITMVHVTLKEIEGSLSPD